MEAAQSDGAFTLDKYHRMHDIEQYLMRLRKDYPELVTIVEVSTSFLHTEYRDSWEGATRIVRLPWSSSVVHAVREIKRLYGSMEGSMLEVGKKPMQKVI